MPRTPRFVPEAIHPANHENSLNTLPAVERASADRITYSHDFQVRCMAQYLRGNGPTSIFASAGLDPKIVGGKRIERAIAHWKANPQIMLEARDFANASGFDQHDLLVLTQSMTIKWLEKKVIDLQTRINALETVGNTDTVTMMPVRQLVGSAA